jgi:hypothetical protein
VRGVAIASSSSHGKAEFNFPVNNFAGTPQGMPLELSKPEATRAGAKAMRIPDGLMLRLLDCVTGDSVAITADQATVAQWRQARTEASYRDDMWSLQVFKAATVFLERSRTLRPC